MSKKDGLRNDIPNSPKGIKAIKHRKDFESKWGWELEEYADSPKKLIGNIKFSEWYEVCLICIDNGLSFAEFLRLSIRSNIKNIPRMASDLEKKNESKNATTKKRNAVKKKKYEQGSLF